jgi:predicted nucleotidyltransferase
MNKNVLSTERLRAMLKAFKEQHAADYHLKALGYFGSYSRQEATADSDIDVVFQTDHPDLFLTAMLKQDLEIWLDHPVDVIRLREAMNPRLKARIEREATYV